MLLLLVARCSGFNWPETKSASSTATGIATAASCANASANPTDSCFIFVSTTGSDANPGTKSAPKLTIAAGVAAATANSRAVAVCAGTYPEGGLTIIQSTFILGAYNCSTWTRTATFSYPTFDGVNATIISNPGFPAFENTLTFSSAAVSQGLLEGFIVQGGVSGGTQGGIALVIQNGAKPAISDCKILGGGSTSSGGGFPASTGLKIFDADPEIRKSEIRGGTGLTNVVSNYASLGLSISGTAAPYVHDNNIYGGTGVSSAASPCQGSLGVLISTSGTMNEGNGKPFANNYVTGDGGTCTAAGAGTFDITRGIRITDFAGDLTIKKSQIYAGSSDHPNGAYSIAAIFIDGSQTGFMRIKQNRIYGGEHYPYVSQNHSNKAIVFMHTSGSYIAYIENNMIHSGNGSYVNPTGDSGTVAIDMFGWANTSALVKINYNTIYNSKGNAPSQPAAIFYHSGNQLVINNNIILGEVRTNEVNLVGAGPGILSFKGNILQPGEGSNALQMRNNVDACGGAWGRIYTPIASLETCFNTLNGGSASGNQAITTAKTDLYAAWSPAGYTEFQNDGWTLKTGIPGYSQGGVDLMGDQPTEDYFGNARTAPFSPGAHEQDL